MLPHLRFLFCVLASARALSRFTFAVVSLSLAVRAGARLAPFLAAAFAAAQVTTQTVDVGSNGDVGQYATMAIVAGNPAVAYYNATDRNLLFARNSAANGNGTWAKSNIATTGDVGQGASLAVVGGNPAAAYCDVTNGALIFSRNSADDGSGTWSALTIDAATGSITDISLVVLSNGLPAIAYYDSLNGDLKFATNALADGSGAWSITTVASTGDQGRGAAMAVLPNGRPAIAFFDFTNLLLRFAVNSAADGAGTWTTTTALALGVTTNVVSECKLVVISGRPAISCTYSLNQTNGDRLSYVRNTAADGSGTWTHTGALPAFLGPHHSLIDLGGVPLLATSGFIYRGADADVSLWSSPFGGSANDSSVLGIVNGKPVRFYCLGGDLWFATNLNADASPNGWSYTKIDTGSLASGATGEYTSVAVVAGTPAISYYETDSHSLRFARNSAADGSGAWTLSTVPTTGAFPGWYGSLVVLDGNPAIVYHDGSSLDLIFTRNSAADGSGTWTTSTVESVTSVGDYLSVALVGGNPAIAYHDLGNDHLKFARNSAADGSGTWAIQTVDSVGNQGNHTSLAVVGGTPAISYRGRADSSLKFARNSAADGTGAWTIVTVDDTGDVGQYTSLVVAGGKPAISYYDVTNTALKFARNSAANGSGTWTITTVDDTAAVGEYARMALINGRPAISYYDATSDDLKLALNSAADGSGTWTISTVDAGGNVGRHVSLAAFGTDLGIAYQDVTNADLKFALVHVTGPEISVEQPALTVLASGATKDLGSIALGASGTAVTFTIRNSGDADLTGLALTKDGAHPADFAVSALSATTVAPGGTATFTVTFTPGAAEFRTAVLHLASNDADENPYDLRLTARGTSSALFAVAQEAWAKPGAVGTTQAGDQFGFAVAVSGNTVVVGAPMEDSSTTGVNSTPNESAADAGAAYVFVRNGTTWTQQAYLKASNAGAGDFFGYSVAISGDTLVVGAYTEDGSATSVNGTQDNGRSDAGAAYVFVRSGTTWTQQAYLKASNAGNSDWFGFAVAISGDTAIVSAPIEDSSSAGVDSTPNESASGAGAVYAFVRSGTTWTQQAYLKPSNNPVNNNFGYAVAIDGDTLVVGAGSENGSNAGVNGTYVAGTTLAGAAYIFQRSGTTWAQQAYLKASNPGMGDVFGRAVAISGDTVAIGAAFEGTAAGGIDPVPDDNLSSPGAVYVFGRVGSTWTQDAFIKAGNTGNLDNFGYSVALSGDTLVVGAYHEGSSTTGVNSTPNEAATNAGAVYSFSRTGSTWAQRAYIKSHATGADDLFGSSVAISGLTIVVGAADEDSSTTGISGAVNESSADSGAVSFFLGSLTSPVPTISNVANTTTNEDTATSALAITLADTDTVVASLTLTGSSSNTTLVPNANIVFSGSGASRTVTVTPAANQSGTATITLTVSDGTHTATDTFVLTVNAVNDVPTISNIADTTTVAGTATSALAFTVGDIETTAASLTVTATSSNTALVPNANLILGGSGANRTLTVTPAGSLTGTSTITVTVSDGTASASDTFVLTVNANTLVVTNANNSGAGSLRQALIDLPAGGTITFDPTFFATSRTITLSSTLTLTKAVTITGPGATKLTLSGHDTVQCFTMESVSSVTFSDLTIAHGKAASGGAIYAGSTTLTLTRCVFQQNSATSSGGAVYNDGGTLIATDCTFTGNTSVDFGAAVAGASPLAAHCVLTRCTFSGQTGTFESLYLQDGTGCLVSNSTFSGNAGSLVCAMSFRDVAVTVTNCTVVANTGAKAIFSMGTSAVVLSNSIVAGNSTYDYAGTALAAGSINNLISTTDAHGLVDGVNGNRIGITDPLLAPLGNYGGLTQTRPPYATSPALNAGTATGAPTTDQRGVARPQGAAIDIGAVEQSVAITPTTVAGGTQNSAYTPVTFSATGGTSPYTWTLLSGSLPTGMTFNTSTRTLSGTPTAAGTFTFAVSATDASGFAGAATYTFAVAALTPPTISNVADLSTAEDTPTPAIAFTVGDAQTAATSLTVTATSSNQTLVPNASIVLGGSGASRTATVTPAANLSGSTTITLTVTDGDSMTATDTFVLTVTAVNDAPTISDVADTSTNEDTATSALAFTVSDVETAAASLTVTGTSSNTTLVPNANIVFGGSGTSRTVTVTPAANQAGTATITLTVSDGSATATDTFVLTVNAANDAPTISNVADVTVAEDTATAARAVTIGDIDTPVATLTLTGSSSNPTLVPNANITFGGSGASRTVTVTPAANQSGTATITLTVSDGALTATDTFVLTVTPVNDAPTISTVANTTTAEETATPALAFTVGDVETAAAALTVSGSSSNTTLVPNASIVFGGSGANRTVVVTPAVNQFGTSTITLTASDGALTATSTFVLTVTAVNDAPTITTIAATSTNEDIATPALAFTVADPETAAASLTVTGASSNTTLVPNASIVFGGSGANRTVTVTPAANQFGTATITLTVSDGALTGTSTFVLTVNAVNDAPTITGIADTTTAEDTTSTALTFSVGDIETAATALTVSGTSSNLTLIPNANIVFGGSGANRTVTVTPAPNRSGTANITVTVSDGTATTSDVFVVTVTAVNDAPTLTALANTTTAEDTATAALAFTIADIETATTALTVSGSSSNPALVPNANIVFAGTGANRTVTVTPAANQVGTASITVTVSDGALTGTTTFLLTVTPANDAPLISDTLDTTTAEDNATAAIPFTIGDVETAATALTVTAISSNTTLVPNANIALAGTDANRTVTITPAANQFGTTTITLTVSDGTASTSDTFVLTVTPVNDVPTISNIADRSTNIDTATGAIAFTIGDVETAATALTVSGTSSNTALVANAALVFGGSGSARTLTVTPAAAQTGTSTITVTVSDGAATASDTFVLTVVNGAPTVSTIADTSIAEDAATPALAFTVADNETAGALLTVTGASDNPTLVPNAAIVFAGTGANRTVTVTPAANAFGAATITVTASDGTLTGSSSFLLTVTPVNDVPTISNITDIATAEDTATSAISFTVGDVETAAGSLTVSATSSNTALVPNAALVLGGSGANRTLIATPAANQSGTTTITVTVSDGSATASDTFVLTVNAVNDAPTISGIPDTTIAEDAATTALVFTVSDVETAAASLTVTATSSNLSLVPNANLILGGSGANRTLTATPAANQTGTATITVTVSDGTATASDSFVLTVTAVNDAPTISDLVDRSTALNTSTGAVAFTIGDIETAPASLTVTAVSSNPALVPNANLVLGGSGANRTITATPAANQTGTATITVTVSDGTATANDTFVLTVSNGAPTATALADTTVAEDTATSALAFTVADTETAAVALTVSGSSSNSALVPNANIVFGGSGASRTVTVTPAANQSGTSTITVSVNDGLLTGTTSFLLTVTAVNDAPTLTNLVDTTTAEDTATPGLAFTVGDVETPVASLTVSATSSNTALVPDANLVFGGAGANRTLTATPAANQSGTTTITVTVSDGTASTSDTFVLTVTAVNDAPSISTISDTSIAEDTATSALAFTVGDIETSAASLTVSATSSNTALVPNANLVLGGAGASRTLIATPAANQSGAATITVTVSDGALTTAATFVLTVTPVNDAPTISNIADRGTNINTATSAIAFTIGDAETAATALTVNATSSNTALIPNAPANLVLGGSGSSRTLTVTPAANQTGTSTLTVTVSDGALTATDTFVLTVSNGAPTISAIADLSTAEDTATAAIAFTVADTETAPAALVVTATSDNLVLIPNANLVLGGSGANRTLTVTPAANAFGTATITVAASDGTLTGTESFLLTVTPVNDAPTISALADTAVAEDTATSALAFTIGDIETAADALTVTATSSNTLLVPNAALVLAGTDVNRTLTATPAANQSGTSTITVTVSDGALTATTTFVLTVSSVNDTPTISNIADRGTNINTPTSAIAFTIGDLETAAAALTVTATSSNTTLVPNANLVLAGTGTTRTITVTPAANETGTATISVIVSDGAASSSDTFVVTVSNGAPTISAIADLTTDEDTPTAALAFTVSDTETAPGALTVTATSDNLTLVPNGNLTLAGSGASRTITVTPAANAFGTVTITIAASDGVLTGTKGFLVTVAPVNDVPTISDLADTSTAQGTATSALAFTVGDIETDATALTVGATSSNTTLVPNANLVFGGSGANRTLTATPAANQSGTATISVSVSDGVLTSTDTFVLTVTAGLPTVVSPTSSAVAATSATLGGNITADGGSPITARGIVIAAAATNLNPRLGGPGVTVLPGTGTTGVFTLAAAGLAPTTTYAYAAYATNAAGTAYSSSATFATSVAPDTTPPTSTIAIAAASTLKTGDTTTVTITFSEPIVAFSNADLTVANGTLSPVSTANNIAFTATFTPSAGVTAASNVITLNNAGFTDLAGNPGVGTTTSNSYAIDTAAPVFTSAPTASATYRSVFSFTVAATDAVTLGASGLPAGLTFTAGTSVIAGSPTVTGTFSVALTATDAVGNVATSTLALTVAKIALTVTGVTAANRVYDATTAATLDFTSALLVGVAGGDVVVLNSASATGAFAEKRVGTAKPVTISGLALAGASAANYTLTAPSPVANITAKALTVSGLTFADKTYDGSVAATIGVSGATLVGVIAPDAVTLDTASVTATFANATVGSGKSVTVSNLALTGADAANYTLTAPTGTASINAIALNLALGNLVQGYDGNPKPVSVNVTGGSGTVSVTYDGSPTAPINAGRYAVLATVTSPGATGSASGTLVIATASQTLLFNLPTLAINTPVTLSATASSRLPVTFALVSGNATLSGTTLTVLDANPVTVRATQVGSGNYDPIFVTRTAAAAGKLAQTITFTAPADRLATGAAFTLDATASSGLPVSFTVVSGPALLAGAELTLTGATGPVIVRASQSGDAAYEAAPDVLVTFLVTPAGTQIYFGNVGPGDGDVLALVLAADGRSGTLVGTIPGTGESFTIEITVDANGDWFADSAVTSVGALATAPQFTSEESSRPVARAAAVRTFRGHLAGGVLTGTISGAAQPFRAVRAASTGQAAAFAGGYRANAPATADSILTFAVGATGQLYVLATAPTYRVAASGSIDASGAFTARSADGATLNGAVDAGGGAIAGVLQRPGFPPESFFGLGFGVRRTDRLINLSSRVRVGPVSGRTLITGFVVGGADAPKRVLLRAVGPALADLGVAGALANPRLQLYDGAGKLLAENDDWSGAELSAAYARVGAFGLPPASRDAALLLTLAPGAYTMHVIDGGENGVALAEIYDASANPNSEYQRLINISSRGEAGVGADVLIGGFVVTGNFPKRVLIRGIGPGLAAFGLSGTLADPRLRVYSGTTVVGENDNWSVVSAEATALGAAASATGAFALAAGSRDAAVILTLPPGAYTAQVSPVDGAAPGVALVEIYEVP